MPKLCDFCGVPGKGPLPTWGFPCRDFDTGIPATLNNPIPTLPITQGSIGEWAACDTCADFIRSGKREQLVQFCVQRHLELSPAMAGVPRQQARPILLVMLRELHSDFWRNREGEPRAVPREEALQPAQAPFVEPTTVPNRRASWLDDLRRGDEKFGV